MAVQAVTTTKDQRPLPVTPGGGKYFAVEGPATKGAFDTPTVFTRSTDVNDTHGQGPGVEAACVACGQYGSVLFVRTHATTVGSASAVTATRAAGTPSTSVVTVDGASTYNGDYEIGMVVTRVVLGAGTAATTGTLGTDHIYVQCSTDNFRTLLPEVKIPDTSTFIVEVANTITGFDSGVQLDCAAGTLTVGDKFTSVITAPACTTADLVTSNAALAATAQPWEGVLLASTISDATPSTGVANAMDQLIVSMADRGLYRYWVGNAPMPTAAQTDAQYQVASAITNFASYGSSTPGLVTARAVITASQNPSNPSQYILPLSYSAGPWINSLPSEQSPADKDLGPLPGVAITDTRGNPLSRTGDESLTPGLDDLRFMVARTWSDKQGVYINLATTMAANGSPMYNVMALRTWNVFATIVYSFYSTRLQKGLGYNDATGFILKSEADRLDELMNAELSKIIGSKCVNARCKVSRRDDLRVKNPTVHVEGGVQPFAYPTFIALNLGFLLPG